MTEQKSRKDGLTRRRFLKATGGRPPWPAWRPAGCSWDKRLETAEVPKKWDEAFDVVVIGSGFAGLTAAIGAKETGASVVIIEKIPVPGATAPAALPLKDHHRKAGLSCLACHGPSEAVVRATADLKPNPHDSVHYGPDLGCDLCHREHAPSVNFCNSCPEFDMNVP